MISSRLPCSVSRFASFSSRLSISCRSRFSATAFGGSIQYNISFSRQPAGILQAAVSRRFFAHGGDGNGASSRPSPPTFDGGPTSPPPLPPPPTFIASPTAARLKHGGLPRLQRVINALAFVDRDVEALKIADVCLSNKRPMTEHPTFISAGQLYGAGKSQMGQHTVARVRDNKQLQEQLVRFSEEEINDYIQAVTVTVDLSKANPAGFQNLSIYLGFALYEAIRTGSESSSLVPEWPEIADENFTHTLERILDRFITETDRSIFVHWDEIGTLAVKRFDECFRWPTPRDRSDPHQVLERYYDFWDAIRPMLRAPRMYTFVTGKQAAFALVGNGLLRLSGRTSPTKHFNLVLGALTAADIAETFRQTKLFDTAEPVSKFVQAADEEQLGRAIHDVTNGHPRLVYACIQALCQLQDDPLVLRTEADIAAALERAYHVISRTRQSAQFLCSTLALQPPFSSAYSTLLAAAQLGVEFDVDDEIALETGDTLPLLEVIDKLDVFADEPRDQPERVRIRVAKWTMRFLRDRPPRELDPLLQPILSLWNAPLEALGQGEPLEWLGRMRLANALALASADTTWAELFPVFRGTLLEDCAVRLDTEQPVRCLPKLLGPKKMKEAAAEDGAEEATAVTLDAIPADRLWSRSIRPTDWKAVFESEKVFPVHTIGWSAPQSYSPDLLVRCDAETVAAFQFRLVGGSSALALAKMQEDVMRARPLLDSHACRRLCLVFVALELSSELRNAFHAGDSTKLVLPAGRWKLRKDKLVTIAAGADQHEVDLEIPEGMELVVLGDAGLCSLLSDQSVKALRELVRDRRNTAVLSKRAAVQMSRLMNVRRRDKTPLRIK